MLWRWWFALAVAVMLQTAIADAQPVRLAPDAETRSVKFRFIGPHELSAEEFSGRIATSGPGAFRGVHGAFAWMPFVPEPDHNPFDPVALQEDVVRLRLHLQREGLPHATVDYDVTTDGDRRQVDVVFLIEEGKPLRVRRLDLRPAGEASHFGIPAEGERELRAAWKRVESNYLGQRFREDGVASLQAGVEEFFADRGFARATVRPVVTVDSAASAVDVEWIVDPGRRSRVGAIDVEGATKVSDAMVVRQLGFEPGSWTSRNAIARGRQHLLAVDLFRSAEVHLQMDAEPDTVLPVMVRIREDRPRFRTVEAGYATDGAGISGQLRWTHPNFTGGARSLNAVGLFQSGWGVSSETQDRLARIALVLNQPYVFAPDISLGIGPSYEWRDGRIDRSVAWSFQSTLVKRFNTLQSAALRYEFTYRSIDASRSAELGIDSRSRRTIRPFTSDALEDSLSEPLRTSLLTLNTTLGGLDDIARPQRGVVLKPNLSITGPRAWGNVEFSRADVQVTTFAPLPGRSNAVMLRGAVGGLWPFGKSIPGAGERPIVELARVRDYVLTAGGPNDVRGYASRMLGPKLPDIDASISGSDTIYTSDRYIDVGGFRRWTATVELRLGLPGSRDIFAHVFGDAGRVWTSDTRFVLSQIPSSEQGVFYAAGGGIGYYTPVGAIRFDVGYKLNPSVFDLRDPQDVIDAIVAGQDASTARINEWRRYAFHLALGLFF